MAIMKIVLVRGHEVHKGSVARAKRRERTWQRNPVDTGTKGTL